MRFAVGWNSCRFIFDFIDGELIVCDQSAETARDTTQPGRGPWSLCRREAQKQDLWEQDV